MAKKLKNRESNCCLKLIHDDIATGGIEFYEYLRNKRCREVNSLWLKLAEDEPTAEEKMILDRYVNATDDLSDSTIT